MQGALSRAFNFGPRAVTAVARTDSTGRNFSLVGRQLYRAFRFREKFLSAAFPLLDPAPRGFPKESGEGESISAVIIAQFPIRTERGTMSPVYPTPVGRPCLPGKPSEGFPTLSPRAFGRFSTVWLAQDIHLTYGALRGWLMKNLYIPGITMAQLSPGKPT